jgi:hypothetical protein
MQRFGIWASMHEARNLAAHTYDLERAKKLGTAIREEYRAAFAALELRLAGLAE